MIGYYIVQSWNGNRTIFKNKITEYDIKNAVVRRETIIDIKNRSYYDINRLEWIPCMFN